MSCFAPLPICTPEEVGIPTSVIEKFLDALESSQTQMHGLMIMRHEKICAQGWWAPYAPGKRHTCHSLTKTYMGTAIGIAIREGLLTLDTLLVDIFPEYKETSTIANVTVHDLLCMGSGVRSMPRASENWVNDFFHIPQLYAPSTNFFYNSAGSTLISYVIQKVSGVPVYQYLKTRLFDIIGIDSEVSFPNETSPEHDMWGHRMQSTTQDNLLLMKLYKDGGIWNGQRILSEEYVKLATTKRIDTASEAANNPPATDNFVGYGYQMWMCKHEGAFRADGSGGQFSIVIPDLDMIVSITESANGAVGAQQVLDCVWDVLLPGVRADALPENPTAASKLRNRMATLAIPAPPYSPYSPIAENVSGKAYHLVSGLFGLTFGEPVEPVPPGEAEGTITLSFRSMEGDLIWCGKSHQQTLTFSMDGTWRRNLVNMPHSNAHECYVAGWWNENNQFELMMELTEAMLGKHLVFSFDGSKMTIGGKTDYMPNGFMFGKTICAEAQL